MCVGLPAVLQELVGEWRELFERVGVRGCLPQCGVDGDLVAASRRDLAPVDRDLSSAVRASDPCGYVVYPPVAIRKRVTTRPVLSGQQQSGVKLFQCSRGPGLSHIRYSCHCPDGELGSNRVGSYQIE